ncbi:MAG: UDP-N-acetylmuramoyl-tripeptide--D-alanyl-D-alanine ligase [Patescibacteria group bacterium]
MVKNIWRGFLAQILGRQADFLLKKFQPMVVGVTGSVGKTMTKELIYTVLREKNDTIRNEGNFNNEIGVPLSIIGLDKPQGVVDWLGFLAKVDSEIKKRKNFPAYLVLELGADRQGDIKKLCKLVRPTIGVVTTVGASHLEYFLTMKNIVKEKRSLIESLPKHGWAILNYDDNNVLRMRTKTKAKVLTYGYKDGADLRAANVTFDFSGTFFKLVYQGSMIPVKINNVGYPYVKASLAAIAVGLAVGMEIIDIVNGLSKLGKVPGRMNFLEGERDIMILDDTYNASPTSMLAAFDTIRALKIKKRKVAILGSMWELGKEEEKGHIEVGKMAGKIFDEVVLLEKNSNFYEKGLLQSKIAREKIHLFSTIDVLLDHIENIVLPGDFLFLKGSRSKNHLEKVVKLFMREKSQAEKLLVAHGKD